MISYVISYHDKAYMIRMISYMTSYMHDIISHTLMYDIIYDVFDIL
jgi:hypothetical protein